ncbi:hypothetical protein [Methanoregula sp.]|uniref:hypothetical protein n=1 Tax=Methanoregula sp. TaxID=2052170 RepID=UPI00260500F2|nr:hypothetical protein [Methanoregula sp.]MDD5142532.1 hypothetical protein [Methanoregula sp.]
MPDDIEMNCVWLDLKIEKTSHSFISDQIDKIAFFEQINSDNGKLFEDMKEWQNRVVPYSLPLD